MKAINLFNHNRVDADFFNLGNPLDRIIGASPLFLAPPLC